MAPNKKKKKPVTNPARGFATTSVASKARNHQNDEKIPDSEPENDRNAGDVDGHIVGSANKKNTDTHRPTESKELSQLSPEEFERHLEEGELQTLIEEHGENKQRLVSRQVSKLQTERRLLRSHAEPLLLRTWLSPEIERSLMDQYKSHSEIKLEEVNRDALKFEDDLIIRLWTLHELLPRIGFTAEQRWSALEGLLRRSPRLSSPAFKVDKDTVWGLEECMDWFAYSTDMDFATLAVAKEPEPSTSNPASFAEGNRASDMLGSEPTESEPIQASSHNNSSGIIKPSSNDEHSRPSITPGSDNTSQNVHRVNQSDSDLEPDQMIERYLTLQSERFQLDPETGSKPSKKKAPKGFDEKKTDSQVASRLKQIDLKLTKLRSDVLFDQSEADMRWNSNRIVLAKESAMRRKLDLDLTESDRANEGVEVQLSESPSRPISPGRVEDKEDEHLLRGLFLEVEDEPANGSGHSRERNSTSQDIILKDFGKWSGVSPRRVLEDSCKARDSGARIIYKVISDSVFSNRHLLQIKWSRSQPASIPVHIEGVSCSHENRLCYVKMERISCASQLQSEAYVSTVALFLTFSTSPKEEKAYLRLPAVWRDLWQDLSETSKEQSDAESRDVLKSLRALKGSETVLSQTPVSEDVSKEIQNDPEKPHHGTRKANVHAKAEDSKPFDWVSRSSGHAYQSMLISRGKLPIWAFRDELLQASKSHQILIVCGETGCGKSTQVPAFILEESFSAGNACKVICAEPRRISAISLAYRVSQELGERRGDLGSHRSLVGYSIRLENRVGSQTRLIYATTGIVMRMVESDDGLDDITHLILDEVHERTIETDFLLIILKKLMKQRPDLRVILMSATVDAQKFSTYLDQAPIITVPGRTFPVETKYLEDAIEITNFRMSGDSALPPEMDHYDEEDADLEDSVTLSSTELKGYTPKTLEMLKKFNEYIIDYALIVRLLHTIATDPSFSEYSKAILIFLPGIAEIRKLNDQLANNRTFANGWQVYPLHSAIATEEQERAFIMPPAGIRKIVIATNIAETGITIPDITCVVDAGKHREMRFDEKKQLSRLIESFISQANAKQRRGRAGRVQKGLCFHLFTKHRYENIMPKQQTPEMLRLSLQDLVLRVKICKLGGVEQVLSEALDPPSAKNVRRAIDALTDVKALTKTEDLTPLGRQLAKLPLDVFLGKLIIYGSIFSCLDVAATVAAILTSKSPFSAPIGARSQADSARLAFAKGHSDLLTVFDAYAAWKRVCNANGISEYQYCRNNFLNPQTLSNIENLKGQLLSSLAEAGFVNLNEAERVSLNKSRSHSRRREFVLVPPRYDTNSGNELIVNSVIAWSFYPKLLRRDGKGWRNIANNQSVSLHPTSVNKGSNQPLRWLSFYNIMQSSSKFYNAHETSAVEDFAVALLCGDAEFKMYSGVIVIDGNRVRFSVDRWRSMLLIKTLRKQLQGILTHSIQNPEKGLSPQQQALFDIWQQMFTREEKKPVG